MKTLCVVMDLCSKVRLLCANTMVSAGTVSGLLLLLNKIIKNGTFTTTHLQKKHLKMKAGCLDKLKMNLVKL